MSHGHDHEDGCCGDASRRVDAALTRMKERSLRVTAPRMSILRVLAESADPLSAEDVHRQAGHGALDLVTAYRSLVALEEAGVVQRHPMERGKTLYALATGHHHHHVVCRKCGLIERLPGCDISRIESAAKAKGYSDLTHVMEIYGVCPACSAHG